MVNTGRGRRNGIFYRFCGHEDHLTYRSQCDLPSARSVSTSRPKTFVEIVGLKEPANFAVVATRVVMLLFLAGVMSITAPVVGAEIAGVPEGHGSALAIPGETCKVHPQSNWIQSEKWAWTQVCEARIANFNWHLGADLLDPRDGEDEENLSDRILRSSFLETILLHEPFRSAIPRQGVRIIGAYFPNRIDLSDASIDRPLSLEQSRFELNVKLRRLVTSTFISFQGSILKGVLYMNSATVGGDLLLSDKAEFKAVFLAETKIGGQIDMTDSKFKGKLNMYGATVGGDLSMFDAEFKAVFLAETNIDGQFDMSDSKFKGRLSMHSATVGGDLFMNGGAHFDAVYLVGAKIGGRISMSGSKFEGELSMNGAAVGGDLFMSGGAHFDAVNLVGANIGGAIDMRRSKFKGKLNMNSARVEGHLSMGEGAEFNAVDLVGVTIGGQIAMVDSKFNGELSMETVTVGRDLYMNANSEFKAVNLAEAKIGGRISMTDSKFMGKLNMNSATVGSHLFMDGNAEFNAVDLAGAKIGGQISMTDSKFKGELSMETVTVGRDLLMRKRAEFYAVNLKGAKIGGLIDMSGSKFKGKLDMNSATLGSHLFMDGNAEFKAVDLAGAKIGGQIEMIGSKFKGELKINSATVEGDLFMSGGAHFDAVNLAGAKIGGRIEMIGSKFKGELKMNSATVGSHVLMREGAEFEAVDLAGAKIGGQIEMIGSKFKGDLNMDSATVGSHLFMGATVRESLLLNMKSEFKDVDLAGANIGGVLIMTGATFEGQVIMDYAMIGSHLMIHGAIFKNSDILSLQHTNVGTLQDDENVWPDTLNLDGFTYKRLVGKDGSDEAAKRGGDWFEMWLAKNDLYSPQPYRHLASVLRVAGHNDMADEILVASRDREREESSMLEIKWWVLTLLKFFIGYGYGNWNFLALLWAAALVLIGTFVLNWTKEREINNEFHNRLDPFFYSLDMLLPIIRLREHHYKNVDLKTRARYYFYFHQVMGYVLIFFVIAGLSGLTS